jgi:uncharacterized membrane protein
VIVTAQMRFAYPLLLLFHLLAVVVWVGGMFLMHFAVRPTAVEQLEPPARLPLLTGVLGRFFRWVTIAVVVIIASGFAMILGAGGFATAHVSVHLMLALGLLMTAIYAWIRVSFFARLQAAVAARDWPTAAGSLDRLRRLVEINLVLGIATIAVAIVGRLL